MSPKRHIRVTKRGTRRIDLDTKIIAAFFIVALIFCVMIFLSMGSRTPVHGKSVSGAIVNLRNSLRGWEKSAELVNTMQAPDARSHSGFHFQWNKKLNPPLWNLETQQRNTRQDSLQKILKLGKAKLELQPRSDNQELFELREDLLKGGEARLEKRVLPILPGEKLQISYPAGIYLNKGWKIRLRSVGATQDRLDAPLSMYYGFQHGEKSLLEIEPKGQAADLDIPPSGEFARHGEKNFEISWPESASGLLAVEGFQLTIADSDSNSPQTRTLIIQIDALNGSLTNLNQTLKTLAKASAHSNATFHLTKVIPPADRSELSQKSLLTWRSPVELGATLSNEKLKSFMNPEPLLLKKYSERGGSIRRLTLGHESDACSKECRSRVASDDWSEHFSSSISILRREEISSTANLIRNDEFLTDPGVLFVDVQFPAEAFRLNWTTALDGRDSLLRWTFAGLKGMLGRPQTEARQSEKTAQLDSWLAKVIESFFVTSNHADIAIFLHNNQSPAEAPAVDRIKNLVEGEAIFSINNFNPAETKNSELHQIKSYISLVSAMKLFEKISHAKDRKGKIEDFIIGTDFENTPISQLSENTIITITPQGWLTDQLPHKENNNRSVFHASPEQIYSVQEKSLSERRRERLHGLHILLPNNNEKDELLDISISTNLKAIGCESESENAQLDAHIEELAESPAAMKNFRVLGRRSALSQWHLHCLLEGRISTTSRLKIVPRVNKQAIARDRIGLGEYALPVRGFLWQSPETLELAGAQILDSTAAVRAADKDAAQQTSIVIWTDSIPSGLASPRAVFSLAKAERIQETDGSVKAKADRLSGK